jgi:hypothetical protein
MGSKSNVMVLADSLHHDDMRNISTNFGWSNTSTFWIILWTVLKDYKVYGRAEAGAGIFVRTDFFR